jgi:hypothetical protein
VQPPGVFGGTIPACRDRKGETFRTLRPPLFADEPAGDATPAATPAAQGPGRTGRRGPEQHASNVIPIPGSAAEPASQLNPTLAQAKNEIHAQLLAGHTAQIDINNRAGIRRLLQQLTEEHFRAKPNLAVTTADRERLVEALFDEVVGLGPLETLFATRRSRR